MEETIAPGTTNEAYALCSQHSLFLLTAKHKNKRKIQGKKLEPAGSVPPIWLIITALPQSSSIHIPAHRYRLASSHPCLANGSLLAFELQGVEA
ncbi:MAG TPA: hypothetical protein VHL60_05150 [Oxalicibacterium sp.]|nr:hypothetical protein [Oxalicibacterium sp.]